MKPDRNFIKEMNLIRRIIVLMTTESEIMLGQVWYYKD